MMTSFYNLLKYAKTGLASPEMPAYDKMRALAMAGGKVKTLTGVPPLSFRANGKPLISWSMSGNAQQNGTPTPDNPIMPELVGDRTRNLFDAKNATETDKYITNAGTIETGANGDRFLLQTIQCRPDTQYTFSWKSIVLGSNNNTPYIRVSEYDSNNNFILRNLINCLNDDLYKYRTITTSSQTVKLDIRYDYNCSRGQSINDIMLNAGRNPLPYEPYGYKLPITNAGQTTPVYLGQVQTTRKIKKLVLDGTENLSVDTSTNQAVMQLTPTARSRTVFSTHYKGVIQASTGNVWINAALNRLFIMDTVNATSAAVFKRFLAAQYAAGTPVTIWYDLATPETGIVNEPLCKIGDYADELHSADAGVSIPTARGQNTLTVDTDLQPSSMTITYR